MKRSVCSVRAACMLLALPSVFSFTYMLRTNQNFTMLNHSVVSILLWWACFRILQEAASRMNRRLALVSLPLGAMLAFGMVAGSLVMQYQSARLFELKTWVGIACATPLGISVCALLMDIRPEALPRMRISWLDHCPPRTLFLLCWAVIFLAWIPGLLAAYPGVYGYDAPFQLDYYLRGSFSTHHPVLHSWLFGFFVVTVGKWLGSMEAGMCVYSVLQMLALSSCFASVVVYLRNRGAGSLMAVLCTALFALLPIHAIFSFSATKDVLFSVAVTSTVLWLLNAIHEPQSLGKISKWVRLALCGIGMSVLRNQGVYVFVFAMLACFVLWKGARLRFLTVAAAVALLFGVLQGPVYTMMKAERVENVQEMLSVPLMQMACARVRHGTEMPPEDCEAIESYLPNWNYYDHTTWAISDPIKNTFNTVLFHEDPAAFVRLWARVGLAYPQAYIDAFLRMTAGYWYPDMTGRDWSAQQPYYQYCNIVWEGWPTMERSTPRALEWLANLYEELATYNSDQKMPVISLITGGSASLAAWTLLLFAGWAVYRHQWRMLCPAALLLGLWGTIMLGPVVLMRYAYPLLMAQPLLIGTVIAET